MIEAFERHLAVNQFSQGAEKCKTDEERVKFCLDYLKKMDKLPNPPNPPLPEPVHMPVMEPTPSRVGHDVVIKDLPEYTTSPTRTRRHKKIFTQASIDRNLFDRISHQEKMDYYVYIQKELLNTLAYEIGRNKLVKFETSTDYSCWQDRIIATIEIVEP